MVRSFTPLGAPGRCPRCWLIAEFCLCARVEPRVESQPRVLIVRHHWEARKSSGTARIAELLLSNLRILDLDEDPEPARQQLRTLRAAWFLYPGTEAPARLREPPETLVVLDGTWRQTRRMVRRLPELSLLPRLSLPEACAPLSRLREPPRPGARSTLESIADALTALGSVDHGERLLALHRIFVRQTLLARGSQRAGKSES